MRSRTRRQRSRRPPLRSSFAAPLALECRRLLAAVDALLVFQQDPQFPGSTVIEANIGEPQEFTLVITLQPGSYDQFRIDTALPEGLALSSLDILAIGPLLSTSVPGGIDSILGSARRQLAAGQSPVLDFGTITCPDRSIGKIILTGKAIVTNSPSVQDGGGLSGRMTISSGGAIVATPTTLPLLIREAALAVDATVAPIEGEAGAGVIEYTVTVTHAANSHAPAYDVDVSGFLGAGLDLVPGSLVIANPGPGASPAGPSGIAIPKLLPGESVTFRYRATINGDAPAGGSVAGGARATWTSLPGDVSRPQSPLDPTSTERTGSTSDPGGPANDYRVEDRADLAIRGRQIDGSVYVDLNFNGLRDGDEPGIAGATILLSGRDVFGRNISRTATTDRDGHYSFANLHPSDAAGYALAEIQPDGLIDGPDRVGTASGIPLGTLSGEDAIAGIVLAPGGADPSGYDFGEWKPSKLSGRAFLDLNGDGTFQPSTEPGIADVLYTLTGIDDRGKQVGLTVRTGPDGTFLFPMLRPSGPGGYTVAQTQPGAYLDGETSSPRGNVTYNVVAGITLDRGEALGGLSFAELEPASLSGQVFIDPENDGVRAPGEAGIAGITIILAGIDDRGNAVTLTTVTDAGGKYRFDRLRPSGPGGYAIAQRQADVDALGLLDGKDAAVPGVDSSTKNRFGSIPLAPGADPAGFDFAELRPSSISGLVFHDALEDGTYGPGDFPVAGVVVILSGADDRGQPVLITLRTDANGRYTFPTLRPSGPGGYRVDEIQPAHLLNGDARAGTAGGTPLDGDAIASIRLGAGTDATGYVFRELTPRADLSVSIIAPSQRPDVGDEIAIVISVENQGPSVPDNYQLEVALPAGLTLLGTSASAGTFNPATGRWSVPNQAVGARAELTLRLRVSGPQAGEVRARIASSSLPDPDEADNQAAVTIKPLVSDLSIAVATSAGLPAIGDVVQWTVDLANVGPDPARQIATRIDLPAGVHLVGTASGPGTFDSTTGTWRLDELAPGASARLTLSVRIVAPEPGTFRAEVASARTYDSDSTPGNGVASEDDLASLVQRALPLSSLSGSVVLANGNNPAGPSLGGIPGVRIFLTGTDVLGNPVARETSTDHRGAFRFDDLFPGIYTIREEQPGAYNDGPDFAGSLGGAVGDDSFGPITVGPDRHGTGYEFREFGVGLSGSVFVDENHNGIRDGGEAGLTGVEIALIGADGSVVATTTTKAGGFYGFEDVPLGTYAIRQLRQPPGYGSSTPNEIRGVVVSSGGLAGLDFGETTGSLSGLAYLDLNGNGIRDPNDPGLAGIEIALTGTDVTGASISRTTITDASGAYTFDGLLEGTYALVQPQQPPQYLDGPETPGTAGGIVSPSAPDTISQIALAPGQQATGYIFSERSGIDLSVASFTADVRFPGPGDLITLTLVIRNDGPLDATGVRVSLPLPGGLEYRFDRVTGGIYDPSTGTWNIGDVPAGAERTLILQGVAAGGPIGEVVAEVVAADQPDVDSTPGGGPEDEDDRAVVSILPRSTLTGRVYLDRDEDGTFAGSDSGIGGVWIQLSGIDEEGRPVNRETLTDVDGTYRFEGLLPGKYSIIQHQPEGYRNGPSLPGSVGGFGGQDIISGINVGGGQFAFGYDFTELPTNLSGTAFLDANRNSIRDPGEGPAPDVTVQLFDALGRLVATAETDSLGIYRFEGLDPSNYVVQCSVPTGYGLSTPARVPVALSVESGVGAPFGLTLGAISGDVFVDRNDNGIRDLGEAGIADALVSLSGIDARGNIVELTTRTAADGTFAFDQLLGGTYQVRADRPAGLLVGRATAGATGGIVQGDRVESIRLDPGSTTGGLGFGTLRPASLSGWVAFDRNQDDEFGAEDRPIAGVEVRLVGFDHLGQRVDLVAMTDPQGRFEFANLRPSGPAGYRIEEIQPTGFRDGPALAPEDRRVKVAVNAFDEISLLEGEQEDGFRFLERGLVLAGRVFYDANRNGRLDPGESGIPDQPLALSLDDGTLAEVVVTDGQGTFRFSPVISNGYTVNTATPAGLEPTTRINQDLFLTPEFVGTVDFGFAPPVDNHVTPLPDLNENLSSTSSFATVASNLASSYLGQSTAGTTESASAPAITNRYNVQSSSGSMLGGGWSGSAPTTAMDNATKNNNAGSRGGGSQFDPRMLLELSNLGRIRDRLDADWLGSIRGLSDWEGLARALLAAGIGRDVAELQPVLRNSVEIVATFPDIFRPAAPEGLKLDALRDDPIPDSIFLPVRRPPSVAGPGAIPIAIPSPGPSSSPSRPTGNPILRRMSGLEDALEDAKRGVRERFQGASGSTLAPEPTTMEGGAGLPETPALPALGGGLVAFGWWLGRPWRRRRKAREAACPPPRRGEPSGP